ncbi:MAG: ATP-binding protein [Alphaproteobacteria bacterium]|nr:ATP-binding protein [Candidatus Jidaibacter sp.]
MIDSLLKDLYYQDKISELSSVRKSLFFRFFLIILLPMILLQCIMGYIFYERHWDNIYKRLEQNWVGELKVLQRVYETSSFVEVSKIASYMGYVVVKSKQPIKDHVYGDDQYLKQVRQVASEALNIKADTYYGQDKGAIILEIKINSEYLHIKFPSKKLYSPTTFIFFLWMLGSASLLVLIAIVLMKNQIRAILQLADAAEKLGKGQDIGRFKPTGAKEVRIAGKAFLRMKQRIERQIYFRTQLLGHISHDLRTPLTRMRLNTEFIENKAICADLNEEISNMEGVIEEYLNFAKAEGNEHTSRFNLPHTVSNIISRYKNGIIKFSAPKKEISVTLRKHGIERVLSNLLDNALKFAKSEVHVTLYSKHEHWYLIIEDDGIGIPESYFKKVFKPFFKIDKNSKGFGLGLAIVKSIIYSHGGRIKLAKSKLGGLQTIIKVPL